MVFEIKQINSHKLDLATFEKVSWVTSESFRMPAEATPFMVEMQKYVYSHSTLPWQLLYILDGETVAGSLMVIVRDSMSKGKKDLLFSAVNTNVDSKYRKKGLMTELFNFVFRVYEDHEVSVGDERFAVCEETGKECLEFVQTLNIERCYWSLYSMVADYYKRFGFHPFRSMNYFKQKPIKLLTDQVFNLNSDEEYITEKNIAYFMTDPKFIPFPLISQDPNERSCSFECTTAPNFFMRLKKLAELVGTTLEHVGLHVKDDFGESLIVLTQHFGPEEVMIQRMYTSVVNDKALARHLDRLYAYLEHYIKSNLAKFLNNEIGKEGQIIWFSPADMLTTTERAKQATIDFIGREKGWRWDDLNEENLPMLREYKAGPVDDLKWSFNGFYSYD